MTRKRPIRKDRVFLAAIVVLAAILVPILFLRGRSPAPQAAASEESSGSPPVAAAGATEGAQAALPQGGPASPVSPLDETGDGQMPVPVQPLILIHTLREGETLPGIAADLGVSVEALMASNRILSPESLAPGQAVRVSHLGLLHIIRAGQTLTDIALEYGVPAKEIAALNGITDPETIYAGKELIVPGASPSVWEQVRRLSLGQATRFINPVEGKRVALFGYQDDPILGWRDHQGIDFDVPVGTTVCAAAAGHVYFVGELDGPGALVVIEHADGYYSTYAHLSKTLVSVGQFVDSGQAIAESGNSGVSSGPHLHFEIRTRDFPVDPLRYLP